MHDPCTVAFDIRRPWPKHTSILKDGSKYRYYPAIITIWHVDPETDGTDDSCGWTWPKASAADRELAKDLARSEFKFWLGQYGDTASGGIPWTARDVIWWAWVCVASKRRKLRRAALSAGELHEIDLLSCDPYDNIRRTVMEAGSEEGLERLFLTVDRLYRRYHRPWWRHPKWHVRHWRIQIHPWQQFRRWLLTRCEHCGKGFRYGESPVSHSWNRERTRFLRGERGLYHENCSIDVSRTAAAAHEAKQQVMH